MQAIRLCREYATQKLEEAQESDLFVYGMQQVYAYALMHGVIVSRDGLECHLTMKFEHSNFKNYAFGFNANLCA